MVRSRTLTDAWYDVVVEIYEKGTLEYRKSWGQNCKTLRNILIVVEDTVNDRMNPKAPVGEDFGTQYFLEQIWSPDKKDYAYTYGERMRKPIDQLEEAVKILKEDPTSRRAVIEIGRPEDVKSKDPACMRMIKFDIDQKTSKLNVYCVFRSWDAYKALPANLFALAMLQEYVAKELGKEIGKMFAYGMDTHIYEKDLSFVKSLFEEKRPKWYEKAKEI